MSIEYEILIRDKLKEFLLEDVHFEDISSSIIPNTNGRAEIIAKEDGFLGGLKEAGILFKIVNCTLVPKIEEGEKFQRGDIIGVIDGPLRAILLAERTALDLLMHLSGVVTSTRTFQGIIEKNRVNPRCKVAATRKTIPGFRLMDKRAVKIGGGDTHRWNLDDMVILKDTHRAYFDNIKLMIESCKNLTSFTKKIEVEVETLDDALTAAKAGADIIMLDNMNVNSIKVIDSKLKDLGLREHLVLESSGNITLENIKDYSETGVDLISTSAITLKAHPIDFSLELS
ncbi:MAG: carboxylating nicotinate-nucleotide diphosphorylase [Promethearchaeota archaeon]